MQFNGDVSGKLTPLPRPSIDTGMGLERIAAVLEGKISNYETDLFEPLINLAASLSSSFRFDVDPSTIPSFRIIADHARATAFLISDGVFPSNEGRGYVLRKIMRRALRHVHLMKMEKFALSATVTTVLDQMKEAYPELATTHGSVDQVVRNEEDRFWRTLEVGLRKLEIELDEARDSFKIIAAASADLKSGAHFGMTEEQKVETHKRAAL